MDKNSNFSAELCLDIMLNDFEAKSLFKYGPLSWFKLYWTAGTVLKKGSKSEKQTELIYRVFSQYTHFKKASRKFMIDGHRLILTRIITNYLNQLPPSSNRSETGKRAVFRLLKNSLLSGEIVHNDSFDKIERIAEKITNR